MVGRYYEGGISSVYMWDLEEGFAAVILIKKSKSNSNYCFFNFHLQLAIIATN